MVDTRNVKIYVLKHPDTLEVRYVGKTVRSLSRRLGNHIANAKGSKHNKRLSNWILKILSDNKRPVIELIEECSYQNWQEREIYWILKFSNLINLTEGGDGCRGFIHNKLTIEKIRQSKLGYKHTQEFKGNMSKRLKGVKFSKEHREKISKALKGRKASEETKLKLSNSHRGIEQSYESRLKRSKSITEWWKKRKSGKDIVKSE